jgi:hypothetical protein
MDTLAWAAGTIILGIFLGLLACRILDRVEANMKDLPPGIAGQIFFILKDLWRNGL